jgi:hypothetical protein
MMEPPQRIASPRRRLARVATERSELRRRRAEVATAHCESTSWTCLNSHRASQASSSSYWTHHRTSRATSSTSTSRAPIIVSSVHTSRCSLPGVTSECRLHPEQGPLIASEDRCEGRHCPGEACEVAETPNAPRKDASEPPAAPWPLPASACQAPGERRQPAANRRQPPSMRSTACDARERAPANGVSGTVDVTAPLAS